MYNHIWSIRIKFKVTENSKKAIFRDFVSLFIFPIKSLNKLILYDSNIPKKIAQMNALYTIYSAIVIEMFDVKFVYAIYPRIYIHQGIKVLSLFDIMDKIMFFLQNE